MPRCPGRSGAWGGLGVSPFFPRGSKAPLFGAARLCGRVLVSCGRVRRGKRVTTFFHCVLRRRGSSPARRLPEPVPEPVPEQDPVPDPNRTPSRSPPCPELLRSCPAQSEMLVWAAGSALQRLPSALCPGSAQPNLQLGAAKILPVSHVALWDVTFKPTAQKIPEGEAGFPGKRGAQLSAARRLFSGSAAAGCGLSLCWRHVVHAKGLERPDMARLLCSVSQLTAATPQSPQEAGHGAGQRGRG